MGDADGSLDPHESAPKRHLDPFSLFCVYNTAKTPNAFQWVYNPQNYPFPMGGLKLQEWTLAEDIAGWKLQKWTMTE